jgi:V/A-type H+-transporting ATPase subunit D
MARTFRLTQPELRNQRERLRRFLRYLPLLKLKQRQIQIRLFALEEELRAAQEARREIARRIAAWGALLDEPAGVDLEGLARPSAVERGEQNVAGVRLPLLGTIAFPVPRHSLFGTPAWVERAVDELREATRRRLRVEFLEEARLLLAAELARVVQRVNLFEKVMIPGAREAIRVIRIKLGDDLVASVGRAKIAKAKLAEIEERIQLPASGSGAGGNA